MSLIANGAGESADANFYNGAATQSVRFPAGEPDLQRTPGTSGNQKKWTSSFWVKRTKLGTGYLWSGASYSGNDGIAGIYFDSDQLHTYYDGSAARYGAIGPDLYRDVNAWYHIVWAVDAANTVHRIWVNGVLRSTNTGRYPENFAWGMNRQGSISKFGEAAWGNSVNFEGYLADFYHLDGQYLDYTSFAEFKNGVLIPKVTSGLTFGTNGFHLEFKENSVGSGDTDTIGADTSGEDNHLDSAIIAADDCNMPDSPENNYCVWNTTAKGNVTPTEGSLKLTSNDEDQAGIRGTFQIPLSGKWYWEIYIVALAYVTTVGLADQVQATGKIATAGRGWSFGSWFSDNNSNVTKYVSNASGSAGTNWVTNPANGNIINIAYDADNGTLWFGINGTYINSSGTANPSNNTDPRFSSLAGISWTPFWSSYSSGSPNYITNFGQDPSFAGTLTGNAVGDEGDGSSVSGALFKYAPPTNFLSLCSANIPEPTVGPNSDTNSTDHFETLLYQGSGDDGDDAGAADAQDIAGLDFKPDWVWIKGRNYADHHALFDSNRGVGKYLYGPVTAAEGNQADTLDEFRSDGFGLGADSTGLVNFQDYLYVAWNWKANGGTATATISESGNNPAASVQANPTAGFSIITYTGTGANGTIAHGLGAVPEVMIFKNRTNGTSDDWVIYHGANTAAPATDHLHLNNTLNTADDDTYFNDTKPTSSVLTIGSHVGINTNDETYVAYVFAEIEGYSKFGGYKGNESSDGTFVYTGFRPAFVICKITDGGTTAYYAFFDNKRESANVKDAVIFNSNHAENTDINARSCDFLSNGFKLRSSAFRINGSGDNHVFFAWAETPFKYANAV